MSVAGEADPGAGRVGGGGGGGGVEAAQGPGIPLNHRADPKDLKGLIIQLQQETDDEDIKRVIFKMREDQTVSQSEKQLMQGGAREELVKSYAFLMGCDTKDEKVADLTVKGLARMIAHRVHKELIPKLCPTCNEVKFYGRCDPSRNKCLQCGVGACRDCLPDPIGTGKLIFHLCIDCKKEIESSMGYEALGESHILAKGRKKRRRGAEGTQSQ